MNTLQDKSLLDCYRKAVEFNLDRDFIKLLVKEIKKRNLELEIPVQIGI